MRMSLIQYIGKAPRKRDNVRTGSGREWDYPGAVLEIPEAEKTYYTVHKDVWREVTMKQLEADEIESRSALAAVLPVVEKMPLVALYQLSDIVGGRIGALEADRLRLAQEAAADTERAKAELKDAGPNLPRRKAVATLPTAGAFHHNVRKTAVALSEMDQSDSQQFNLDTGMPLPEAVHDLCGILPTDAEMIEAMAIAKMVPKPRKRDEPKQEDRPPLADEVIEKPAPKSEPQRAQIALEVLDAADISDMLEMADVFKIELPTRKISKDALFPIVQSGLQKIAAQTG